MYPIDWTDVVLVSAYVCLSIGQKSDGSVLVTGKIDGNDVDVSDWNGIVDVAAEESLFWGLKSDGTVLAAGHNGNEYSCAAPDKWLIWAQIIHLTYVYDNNIFLFYQIEKYMVNIQT